MIITFIGLCTAVDIGGVGIIWCRDGVICRETVRLNLRSLETNYSESNVTWITTEVGTLFKSLTTCTDDLLSYAAPAE